MARFIAGEVVVIDFPFSDLSQVKRRPAFVLGQSGVDDVVLCQITSHAPGESTEINLSVTDFLTGGLSRSSFVRVSKLFTLQASLIQRRAGMVSPAKLTEIRASLRRFLGL